MHQFKSCMQVQKLNDGSRGIFPLQFGVFSSIIDQQLVQQQLFHSPALGLGRNRALKRRIVMSSGSAVISRFQVVQIQIGQ